MIGTSTPARRRVTGAVGAPGLLLVIFIVFYWKITLTYQFSWLESADLALQVLPWQEVQVQAFHQGKLPLWDPYLWGGQSLIGQAQPGTAYPLNWVLYSLPRGKDGHIRRIFFNWYYVLIHFLAALFCYWLCRDLERSRLASLIAGTAFGLAGVVGTTEWPQILNGMIWAPLVLLFLLRAVSGRRPLFSASLSGFFLGLSWLSGHHQVPLYFSLGFAGIWLYYISRDRRIDWQILRLAALCGLFLALTSALQVLPAYEYGHLARRWAETPEPVGWKDTIPYTVHHQHSLGLFSIVGLMVPGIHLFADPYEGVIILSLAAFAVILCWNDIRVRLLCVFSLAGLFLALGYQSVFHGFLYGALPMVDKSREPAMFVVLFNFGIAVLIAYGFDSLREQRESLWVSRVAFSLAAVGAVMLALMLGVMMTKNLAFDYDTRIVLVAVLSLLLAGLYNGYQHKNFGITALGVVCVLLLLSDLGNSAGYTFVHRLEKDRALFLHKYSENQDILEWLRRLPDSSRIQIDTHDIPFNYGDWYGLDVYGGYLTSLPADLVRLGLDAVRTRALYAVKYWVGRSPRDPEQFRVFTGASGLMIYEDPRALPRVWTVHQTVALSSESQILPTFEDKTFNLSRAAFFLGDAPKLETCAGDDRASLIREDFDTVILQANMQCRGMVVLGDNWYPGWDATVDGKTAKIWEVDSAIRGVEVDKGGHRIEMHYRPFSVLLGVGMLALSLAGLVIIGRLEPARRS